MCLQSRQTYRSVHWYVMETIEDDVKKLLAGEILSISEVDTGIDNASKNNIKVNAYHTNYMFSIITHACAFMVQ